MMTLVSRTAFISGTEEGNDPGKGLFEAGEFRLFLLLDGFVQHVGHDHPRFGGIAFVPPFLQRDLFREEIGETFQDLRKALQFGFDIVFEMDSHFLGHRKSILGDPVGKFEQRYYGGVRFICQVLHSKLVRPVRLNRFNNPLNSSYLSTRHLIFFYFEPNLSSSSSLRRSFRVAGRCSTMPASWALLKML